MLVVISDLHLTDCSTAANPHSTAFDLLIDELKGSVDAKQPTEIQVVLLGDIFDLVRTSWWHRNAIPAGKRPWGGTLDPKTAMNADTAEVERQFGEVLAGVLASPSSQTLVTKLKALRDIHGKPPRVTYVIGNHDRVLNNFPALQKQIARAFDPLEIRFTNLYTSDEYDVVARHGHEWDENCHGWDFLCKVLDKHSKVGRFDREAYQVMAIGEVVTAELMSGFVWNVEQALGSDPKHAAFLQVVKDVNNLRPMTDVIRWMTWLTRQDELQEYLGVASAAFQQALADTLATSLAKQWDHLKTDLLVRGDLTDSLGWALRILRSHNGMDRLKGLTSVLEDAEKGLAAVRGHQEDDLYVGAKEELGGDDVPATRYLLYGHTHVARQVCFSADTAGGVRMYINTGTFLPLIERTADGKAFFRSNRMTFICFYRKDEDLSGRLGDGPTVDVWDGLKRKDYVTA
jgi:UDP-2,3-diacylglucosamine pyrophosphatase LpxH